MASEEPREKPKRKKIYWACNHCNRAHITCEEARPCSRCIKKGLQDTCADAPRKRKKYLVDVPNPLIEKSAEGNDLQQTAASYQNEPLSSMGEPSTNVKVEKEPRPVLRKGPKLIPKSVQRPHVYKATQVQHSTSLPVALLPKPPKMSMSASMNGQNGRVSPSLFSRVEYNGEYAGLKTYDGHGVDNSIGPQTISVKKVQVNGRSQPPHTLAPTPMPDSFYNSASSIHTLQSLTNYDSDLRGSETRRLISPENNIQRLDQHAQLNPNSLPVEKNRTNFLSSAADMEYATLSSILQDNFMGLNQNYPLTSTEGTPNSTGISPGISPHAYENVPKASPHSSYSANSYTAANSNADFSRTDVEPYGLQNHHYTYSDFPPFDARINQYFLGSSLHYANVKYPDVSEAISIIKRDDPASYHYRNSKSSLSFTMGFPQNPANSRNLLFKNPEEIYSKIKKPFSYTPGFHKLIAYLRSRFPRDMLVKMAESMAVYRPSFIACTNSLREADLIFMEQCFQRTLLTYDNFIKVSGTPTIVWRRTGEIAYVGEEFTTLTGWTQDQLLGGRPTFIVELLDDKSVVMYFQLFSKIAFGDFLGATMTECTLLTPNKNVKIRAGCTWTMKRDVFGIPMMIIGNFLPII